ncbi:transglycosylase family protein [Streptomyces olivochromogenes]|uniref:Peptidoglycan-binding protein LysM n=1 Tax=Streptomyces olivochromogenes TaxID=1963 RepID=A0A250VIN1_STROL|nr:transglycosylase family protein [Streptomyces olivochromogenes]KUN43216.1 peptigoglycan-binding protein LysM [Streptomyces olivochromogenes]GAX53909.1 peptidoglycan-binding protein LysM [Streptomyces olivochromogenes]
MLSGNGRHRRPRQAPALIVAAGVTGSAIAIPLLGATSASAADGTTWDRVAECESAGQWSADSGNGYYGGLQISQADWEKYGGLAYASSADEASRSQQIAIAEKLLDDRGLAAWPTCGPLSGLSKNSGDILVDTGVANDSSSTSDSSGSSNSSDSSSSSGTSAPSGSSGSKSDSSSSGSSSSGSSSKGTGNTTKADTGDDAQGADGSDTDTTKGDDSGNSGQGGDSSGTSENATTGAGRHRGGTADEDTTDSAVDGRGDDSSGRHASRGSGASRDAVDGSYVVRAGDNLWTIADALDLEGGWAELYDANKKTVGVDPNLILPGQSLAVGAESGEK